jgi:Xaa-Pro aminopeptidase
MQDDIVYELKAVKNDCEIQGMKQAHVCFILTMR